MHPSIVTLQQLSVFLHLKETQLLGQVWSLLQHTVDGVSKKTGTPKMDGENNGKLYFLMDDLGVPPF